MNIKASAKQLVVRCLYSDYDRSIILDLAIAKIDLAESGII